MHNELKTYSVKEAADMLGTSEFTIRRKIQNGQLHATIDSKKQGYRISEDSLKDFAKSQESKIGSIWRKLTTIGSIVKTPPLSLFSVVPFVAGGINIPAYTNLEHSDLKKINDVNVIDKMIERLNVELRDFDLQIKYLEFKIKNSKSDSDKINDQEQLFQIQSQKLQIDREIKDLEIKKALIESN